jgi:phenol 2-monooxygenase
MYQLATIVIGVTESAWKAFDGPAMGNLYVDKDAVAHGSYGVYSDNGAIAVIRPDGIFAFGASLKKLEKIEDFFEAIFAKVQPKDGPAPVGREISGTAEPVRSRL